ncbi:hypothetical protein, partial [Escherichia coli]|uniref:hypothetical protein n=1 Tax=Escherichia coli TaxID=562 RepID=UPI00374DBF2E
DRNRSHWSTSKTPSYTKSVSWQHHPNLEEKFHDFMGVILMVLGDESNTSRRFCRIIQKYRGKSKQER